MGDMTKDSLVNPVQSEYIGIHVDIRPKKYYPDESGSQTITLADGTIIPILYYTVQPYIHVWRPTCGEIDPCIRVAFTSRNSWDQLLLDTFTQCSSSTLYSSVSSIEISNLNNSVDMTDPISAQL